VVATAQDCSTALNRVRRTAAPETRSGPQPQDAADVPLRQRLFINFLLQRHKGVQQRLRARRAAWDVHIHRDVPVNPFKHVITLLKRTTGDAQAPMAITYFVRAFGCKAARPCGAIFFVTVRPRSSDPPAAAKGETLRAEAARSQRAMEAAIISIAQQAVQNPGARSSSASPVYRSSSSSGRRLASAIRFSVFHP